jgi:hypothetical protein
MKTPLRSLLTLILLLTLAPPLHADVTGRTEDSTLAGTEKILSDSSGANTFFTVNTLFGATRTLVSPVISTGLTASGSASNNFSGSTGAFQTSSGANTFNGSAHNFAAGLLPTANDGAALGTATYSFSDLYLASGALINWANGNAVLTHSSGVLTLTAGNLIISTAGTATGSVVTNNGTQTLAAKTLTTPVIATGLTASGSASNDFSASTGTFKTSTGINTFGGSSHVFAATLIPSANDGAALGSSSASFSDLFLATGAVVNINNGDWTATHSAGVLTIGTNDDIRMTTSGTNAASVVTVGGTQTLTAKTLTSPTITGPSISGTSAFTGAITTTGAITQTSASATAFSSGLNGATNPVFRLVNNIASQATGISITGRAATAGADITVLSSGTNEPLNIEAKGSGSILLNGTATGAVYVGDRTTPALSVIHTTEGTGVAVTSAAAASGVAVTATSSGTNENLTIDAKGSGTVTVNGTATGSVTVNKLLHTGLTESVTATNVITAAESGSTFFLNSATEFVSTLPAPAAGLRYTFIVVAAPSGASYTVVTNASANIIKGMQICSADAAGDTGTSDDTVTFADGQAVAGDMIEIWSDGTSWFIVAKSRVAAGITFTTAS